MFNYLQRNYEFNFHNCVVKRGFDDMFLGAKMEGVPKKFKIK